MAYTAPFETHTDEYEAWFDKYNEVFESELLAIRTLIEKLPENIQGIEVGLGTGRHAVSLGIKEGVEPASNMREIARKRGIEVMDAPAEMLPYKDLHFDFVLFVTICHLENIKRALKEAHRVLKRDGSIIIAFIDNNSILGKKYIEKKSRSTFYRQARFYTVEEVSGHLNVLGFKNPDFVQTLFKDIDEIQEIEAPKPGYGEGSLVVVMASKKG